MTELKGEYIQDFYKVKEYVEKHAKVGEKRNEAIEMLHSIYLEAQENGTLLSEIHENSAKDYAKEIVEGLPHTSEKKQKIVRRTTIVVLSVIFVVTAFFTSDFWNMYVGGYNYSMKHWDRMYHYSAWNGDQDYIAKVTMSTLNSAESNPELAELGMYIENVDFWKEGEVIIGIRSETIQTSFTSYRHYNPGIWHGASQYYRMEMHSDIFAEINGVMYEATRPFCVDARGRDMKSWILFEPVDEDADTKGAESFFIKGGEITITFDEVDVDVWYYPGLKTMLLEGKIPFFVPYRLNEEE